MANVGLYFILFLFLSNFLGSVHSRARGYVTISPLRGYENGVGQIRLISQIGCCSNGCRAARSRGRIRRYESRASALGTNRLATTAEAVVPYGLELEASTLIAFANGLLPASLKLGSGTKIFTIEGWVRSLGSIRSTVVGAPATGAWARS